MSVYDIYMYGTHPRSLLTFHPSFVCMRTAMVQCHVNLSLIYLSVLTRVCVWVSVSLSAPVFVSLSVSLCVCNVSSGKELRANGATAMEIETVSHTLPECSIEWLPCMDHYALRIHQVFVPIGQGLHVHVLACCAFHRHLLGHLYMHSVMVHRIHTINHK